MTISSKTNGEARTGLAGRGRGAGAVLAIAILLAALAAAPARAAEVHIYTGGAPTGEGSTYHNGIGIALEALIEREGARFGYDVRRIPSNGAVANANACNGDLEHLCFGIGQGGIDYEAVERGTTRIIRNDLPGECAMAFTAGEELPNWRTIKENARRVTFVLPERSGSEAFIRTIFAEEPSLRGIEPNFAFVSGQDAIISKVRSTRGAVGFFYAYPDPTTGLINAAAEAGLTIMGVLSPAVARTSEAFYHNRRAPYRLTMMGLGETRTVETMCSKALLFAGDPDRLADEWARRNYAALTEALAAAPADAFVPQQGPFARLMRQVEDLSEETGVADMVTDLGRQVAAPFN